MKRPRGHYKASEYTPDEKKVVARFSQALRDSGWKWEAVLKLCSNAGYELPERTLREWVALAREGNTPTSSEKQSGRPRALEDEKVAIIIGWFLEQEDNGEKTFQRDFLWIAWNSFHVSLSQATVSRYLAENYLRLKLFGRRSVRSDLPRDEASRRFFEQLQELHASGVFNVPLSNIWCVDVTTDSRRYELPQSWGRINAPQRKLHSPVPAFTSSLVTFVNGLGEQRGPYIFVRCKQLQEGSPEWPAIVKFCKKRHLDSQEILFETKGNSKYFAEDAAMIDHALRLSRPWKGHVFLTDKGNAFRKNGGSLILQHGAKAHYTFDPPIHGKLSINDAHLHPVAKAQWVSLRDNEAPYWKQLLMLAWCISTVPKASTARAWERNFFLKKKLTLAAVDDMLWENKHATNTERENRYKYCFKMYKQFVKGGGVIDWMPSPDVPPELETALDGGYWENE